MKSKILLQIDHDNQPSSFDSIVALDAGVEQLLTYGGSSVFDVEGLIHGAMFTRGPKDLHQTAAFFGGSDVDLTMQMFDRARKCFFGPFQISLMADPNGSNTTAVAAVLSAEKHVALQGATVTVLAATGPVGQRIAQLTARLGAAVQVCSRRLERAQNVCDEIAESIDGAKLQAIEVANSRQAIDVCRDSTVVYGAGAAGVELLAAEWQESESKIKVAIDVNAVPPAGLAGLEVSDNANQRESATCYGAIGVGGLKMKIHKRAIQRMFESNDVCLDLDAIYDIGLSLASET